MRLWFEPRCRFGRSLNFVEAGTVFIFVIDSVGTISLRCVTADEHVHALEGFLHVTTLPVLAWHMHIISMKLPRNCGHICACLVPNHP